MFERCRDFNKLFLRQEINQLILLHKGAYEGFTSSEDFDGLPCDDPKLCSYHVQQLISEIGEILSADKRWKNFRNEKYDSANKLEEIADCFIVLMNIAMYSGFGADETYEAIEDKINKVHKRIREEA